MELLKYILYRPFSIRNISLNIYLRQLRKYAVLDRTKEPGYWRTIISKMLEMLIMKKRKTSYSWWKIWTRFKRYYSSSNCCCIMKLKSRKPKNGFTIGIVDDVTNTSLRTGEAIKTTPEGTIDVNSGDLDQMVLLELTKMQ